MCTCPASTASRRAGASGPSIPRSRSCCCPPTTPRISRLGSPPRGPSPSCRKPRSDQTASCRRGPALQPAELNRASEKASEAIGGVFDGGRLSARESVQRLDLQPDAAPRDRAAPGAADSPPDGDDIREDAAERKELGVERSAGVQNLRSVAVGHCVFVVVREQVRDHSGSPRRTGGRVEPVVLARDGLMIEHPTRQRDAGPRVGHPQAPPPHEVLHLGQAMASPLPPGPPRPPPTP